MLEFIFQGFTEWLYEMALECWEHFLSALLDLLSLDFAYLKTHIPIIPDVMDIMLAVGWSLLLGNLVFQAIKSMMSGLGFDGEDPKLLFTRTFVFAFLLLASPQICQIGLDITSNIVAFLEIRLSFCKMTRQGLSPCRAIFLMRASALNLWSHNRSPPE